ncbi:Orf y [Tanacetum coccineum]
MWQQWRTAYPGAYSALETIADDPQNITSQLAVKSRKLYFPSTTEKLFAKLPPSLSKKIEESFKAKHLGLSAGVLSAIEITHTFVSEMCKDAKHAKELRDLSLCFAIPIPADFDDSSVYSISKGEGDAHQNISIMVQDTLLEEATFMAIEGINDEQINVKGKHPHKPEEEKDFHSNEVRLLKELLQEKTEQVQQMIKDQAKEYYENRAIMQRKEKLWQSEKSLLIKDLIDALKIIDQHKTEQIKFEEQKDEEIRKLKAQLQKEREKESEDRYSSEEFLPVGNPQIARPFMEAEVHYSKNTTTAPKIRKITNQLYNVKVEFEIPNCPMFETTAIIDTGASACCINKKVILEDALEPLTQTVFFDDLNSRQQATHRIKQGSFLIEGNKFKIPLIYAFDMNDSNGIEMLIGANFLRSMKGGIRIEGDEITIYKKVTRIKTSNQTEVAEIAITELKHQGYIGEEPLKHWKKNGELGTTIVPATGREIKGKERMVFNYKSLNDNTYMDQYFLPGFHQVAMDEESIPWTTFLVLGGLYEWLVMPFGLKNAPAVFQRKMDKCFKGTESFIAVYIDDILVFLKNKKGACQAPRKDAENL